MTLFFALIFRILSNPFSNVFQKKLTNSGQNPLWINFMGFLLLAAACVPFAVGVQWSAFGYDFWIYCLLAGIVGAFGNGYLIRAIQYGDLSVIGPINSYKPVVGMLVAIPMLSELPTVWGIVGIAMIIYGSSFILDTLPERFSWKALARPEMKYRIYAMTLTGIEAIFIKKIILLSSPQISFMVWCFFNVSFSFVILYLFRINPRKGFRSLNKKNIPNYLLMVACIGIMQLGTNFSFAHMDVGYALALFQLSSIVSVVLGYRIFHEKQIKKKIIGASIMIAGAAVIILL